LARRLLLPLPLPDTLPTCALSLSNKQNLTKKKEKFKYGLERQGRERVLAYIVWLEITSLRRDTEKRSKGSERSSHTNIWGRSFLTEYEVKVPRQECFL